MLIHIRRDEEGNECLNTRCGCELRICRPGRESALQKYLYVAIGGALGSLARFGIGSFVTNRLGTRFPYGTLIVNITASVILGFCLTLMDRRSEMHDAWRYLIPVGFVGAYSTFSTFEWEAYATLEMGAFLSAALYITASVLLGLTAVWFGIVLGRLLS